MITGGDLYTVLTAMVPLYVAMMLGYASVRWWNTFSAVQCSGINRFVAVFAVPLLSFYFISSNDPYKMDGKFILADSISKVTIFALLSLWARFSRYGSLDWLITLFSLSTLPNTLVMGIPLLGAMYGDYFKGVMVQMVVLQSIIWYTLLLFLFEFRAARLLLLEQFPETAASIVSFKVDADVVSLDGREPLQTQAEVGEDGKIKVFIRRSVSTSQQYELFASPRRSMNLDLFASPRRSNMNNSTLDLFSMGLTTMPSSKAVTPRPSNLTGAEIYSLSSQTTPRDITMGFTTTFNDHPASHAHAHALAAAANGGSLSINTNSGVSFGARHQAAAAASLMHHHSPRHSNFTSCEMYSLQSSRCPTPRASNFHAALNEPDHTIYETSHDDDQHSTNSSSNPTSSSKDIKASTATAGPPFTNNRSGNSLDHHQHQLHSPADDLKDGLNHSFNVWSSSTTPSHPTIADATAASAQLPHDVDHRHPHHHPNMKSDCKAISMPPPGHLNLVGEDFSFGSRAHLVGSPTARSSKQLDHDDILASSKFASYTPQYNTNNGSSSINVNATSTAFSGKGPNSRYNKMPSSTIMVKLILQMVCRKLIRNPNTYASLIGLTWSLIAFRFGVTMPKIISESLRILWQAGLGMAMFSLGLFMALQPRLIACGTSLATFAMAVRFLTGPAVMAASSIAIGMRGVHLHAAIVQAALPQGIVPFVFSREYDLHPDVLSTAVIFGMLVALPVTLLYYVLLGL